MTTEEHLRRVDVLKKAGEIVTVLCTVPLLLSFLYARQRNFDHAWVWFGVFAILYAIDRFLLYRARAHWDYIGEHFRDLHPR